MNCIESLEQGIGLVSGELQLSDGTVLVVDETTIQEGKIENTGITFLFSIMAFYNKLIILNFYYCYCYIIIQGVMNISILGDLFQNQKITYDFNYHTIDFPADINLIVLSEAKSKLFPVCIYLFCFILF